MNIRDKLFATVVAFCFFCFLFAAILIFVLLLSYNTFLAGAFLITLLSLAVGFSYPGE